MSSMAGTLRCLVLNSCQVWQNAEGVTHSRRLTLQPCHTLYGHRHNQELEQDSVALHEEQLRLQQETQALAQRLECILHDKFQHRQLGFDSETPIDKTLTFLQGVIGVSSASHNSHADSWASCMPNNIAGCLLYACKAVQ